MTKLLALMAAMVLLAGCGSSHHTASTETPIDPELAPTGILPGRPPAVFARPPAKGTSAHPLSHADASTLLHEVEKICRQRHLSCSEAKAAFGELQHGKTSGSQIRGGFQILSSREPSLQSP